MKETVSMQKKYGDSISNFESKEWSAGFFKKIVNGQKLVTIFAKKFLYKCLQTPKYSSENRSKNDFSCEILFRKLKNQML